MRDGAIRGNKYIPILSPLAISGFLFWLAFNAVNIGFWVRIGIGAVAYFCLYAGAHRYIDSLNAPEERREILQERLVNWGLVYPIGAAFYGSIAVWLWNLLGGMPPWAAVIIVLLFLILVTLNERR